MRLMTRAILALTVLAITLVAVLYALGSGIGISGYPSRPPNDAPIPAAALAERSRTTGAAAREMGLGRPKEILFGDLHVHTTFSADAFQMSLPMSGGEGAHPVADACDFARFCAGLDFWSINDHGLSLTPDRWKETVATIRQCNEVAGTGRNPDLISLLGWEWTQMGTTPDNHYGHKNVILRGTGDEEIPTRPIAAAPANDDGDLFAVAPHPILVGVLALATAGDGGMAFARYLADTLAPPRCPDGVPVRELPDDCREAARTPGDLFAKLDDWGHDALVIPHGTTWGMYTPQGSAWDKQLTADQHDPDRQTLIEVFSGHGNSEEYRSWREVILREDGSRSCPPPSEDYLPSCWRAGEIIEARCQESGEPADACAERAAEARQLYVDADRNGGRRVVPGETVADWQDSGQCRDCFQPAFNYRPRSAAQYILALGRPGAPEGLERFHFGFIASSDNHSARPGTGYKDIARTTFTEARFGTFEHSELGNAPERDPAPRATAFDPSTTLPPFAIWENERAGSFFLNGGLAAVHARGRSRDALWAGLESREVYGTSGPRILLWFDLLNAPAGSGPLPMGSKARLAEAPIFEVRAIGSREQQPGCPDHVDESLSPAQLERLCRGECHHPSDRRRQITRIEIVRIRPQQSADEAIDALVEDPWRVFSCAPDPAGCRVAFSDEDFRSGARDALYYARAIEEPSLAVAADPLGCSRDASGRCVEVSPCGDRADDDDCLAETEERAWSSPIFVGFDG